MFVLQPNCAKAPRRGVPAANAVLPRYDQARTFVKVLNTLATAVLPVPTWNESHESVHFASNITRSSSYSVGFQLSGNLSSSSAPCTAVYSCIATSAVVPILEQTHNTPSPPFAFRVRCCPACSLASTTCAEWRQEWRWWRSATKALERRCTRKAGARVGQNQDRMRNVQAVPRRGLNVRGGGGWRDNRLPLWSSLFPPGILESVYRVLKSST